jgi:hypothetical protein
MGPEISERTLSDILDTWTPENAQGFGVIAGNADVLSPCDVIRMLPGTFCYEVRRPASNKCIFIHQTG